MKEEIEEAAELAAWFNKNDQIVTFRETAGYEKLTFQTQEDKMAYVCQLCESGYRIL